MNKNKYFAIVIIHTIILIFMLMYMFLWIPANPYILETDSNIMVGGIDMEVVQALRRVSCSCAIINAVIALISWRYSKSFCIIHSVLAEFCALYAITMFFLI